MTFECIPASVVADVCSDQSIPQYTRLWFRQAGKCYWCKRAMTLTRSPSDPKRISLEHIVPKAHGGTSGPANIRAACVRCNTLRGACHHDWFAHVVAMYDGRLPEMRSVAFINLQGAIAAMVSGGKKRPRLRVPAKGVRRAA